MLRLIFIPSGLDSLPRNRDLSIVFEPLETYRGCPEVTRHGKYRPQRYAVATVADFYLARSLSREVILPWIGFNERKSIGPSSRGHFIRYNFGGTLRSGLDKGFPANLGDGLVPPKTATTKNCHPFMPLFNIGEAGFLRTFSEVFHTNKSR